MWPQWQKKLAVHQDTNVLFSTEKICSQDMPDREPATLSCSWGFGPSSNRWTISQGDVGMFQLLTRRFLGLSFPSSPFLSASMIMTKLTLEAACQGWQNTHPHGSLSVCAAQMSAHLELWPWTGMWLSSHLLRSYLGVSLLQMFTFLLQYDHFSSYPLTDLSLAVPSHVAL